MLPDTTPNFFIIGAAKAATTALSTLLMAHPEAGIVRGKEPHFFSTDRNYALGMQYYLGLFAHCRDRHAVGDASTSYSRIRHYPQTISRIQQHTPDARFIYMVRHPLQRMESAYVERLASKNAGLYSSINDAVRRQPMIVDSSRYWEVFDAYRSSFGEDRLKLVWFEDFIADTEGVFAEVCAFLGIREDVAIDAASIRQNARKDALARMTALGRGDMGIDTDWDPHLRRWVIEQIRDDNLRLLRHFGKPADYWGELFG